MTRAVYVHRSPCRHSSEASVKETEVAQIAQTMPTWSMRSQNQA